MNVKREVWIERILTGISALAGLLAFVAAIYGGAAMLWLAMKAPEAFAIVLAAAIIGAAIYFRKPSITYNMQMSHHDTERVMDAVSDMLERVKR